MFYGCEKYREMFYYIHWPLTPRPPLGQNANYQWNTEFEIVPDKVSWLLDGKFGH